MAIRTLSRLGYQWALDHVSIRLRLAVWYALLLAATLSLFGVVVFAVAQYQIENSVDQGLQSNAQIVAQTVQGGLASQQSLSLTPTATQQPTATPTPSPASTASPNPAATATPAPTPTATPLPSIDPQTKQEIKNRLELSDAVKDLLSHLNLTFEVLDARAATVYAPTNLSAMPPHHAAALLDVVQHGACTAYDATQNGAQLRVYLYPLTLPQAKQPAHATVAVSGPTSCAVPAGTPVVGVVMVAKSVDDVNTTVGTLRRLLIAGVFVALALSSLGAWIIAGNGLRPIASLTRTARTIAKTARGGGLGRRVGYRGPRDEVGELASTFDDMLASLEKSSIAQRRFIADAAHELRTPLTTIKGSLELLKKVPDMPEEERGAVVLDAYDEAERMTGLVNDLLLLARADAAVAAGGKAHDDQTRGRRELIELDQLTFEVFRHGRAQLLARPNTRIQLSIGNLEPLVTEGDPGQIRQLLLILLDNALKYTPAGGRVRLSMSQQDGRAAISVKDTGIGIEPEIQPHIFERFFRGDLARERDEHGSGLGLAIAQWMAQAHSGEIRVESAPGAGSTFTVLLPAVRRPGEQTSAKLPIAQLPGVKRRSRFSAAADAVTRPLTRLANASRPRRLKEHGHGPAPSRRGEMPGERGATTGGSGRPDGRQ